MGTLSDMLHNVLQEARRTLAVLTMTDTAAAGDGEAEPGQSVAQVRPSRRAVPGADMDDYSLDGRTGDTFEFRDKYHKL